MAELADWGVDLNPSLDREISQAVGSTEFSDDDTPGWTTTRPQRAFAIPADEPVAMATWVIIVGAIAALALMRKAFSGALA